MCVAHIQEVDVEKVKKTKEGSGNRRGAKSPSTHSSET